MTRQRFPIRYIVSDPFLKYFLDTNGVYIGDPTTLPIKFDRGQWQGFLKGAVADNQRYVCVYCSNNLSDPVHLHHALISRADVVGLDDHTKRLIHHSYNCLALHSSPCHQDITREDSWQSLCCIYGSKNIEQWYQKMQTILGITLPQFESWSCDD